MFLNQYRGEGKTQFSSFKSLFFYWIFNLLNRLRLFFTKKTKWSFEFKNYNNFSLMLVRHLLLHQSYSFMKPNGFMLRDCGFGSLTEKKTSHSLETKNAFIYKTILRQALPRFENCFLCNKNRCKIICVAYIFINSKT